MTAAPRTNGTPPPTVTPSAPAPVRAQVAQAVEALRSAGTHADGTVDVAVIAFRLFASSLERRGVQSLDHATEADVLAWLDEPSLRKPRGKAARYDDPTEYAKHGRRTQARLLFRVARDLGLCRHDPSIDITLPPRSYLGVRALTDDERLTVVVASRPDLRATRRPALVALALAGATNDEAASFRACDADLARLAVRLHRSPSRRRPRTVIVDEWSATAIADQLRRMRLTEDDDEPLLTTARGSITRQVSVSADLGAVLRAAGLAGDADVSRRSLMMWLAASTLRRTGRVEEVAKVMGVTSLDAAADLAGLRWHPDEWSGSP